MKDGASRSRAAALRVLKERFGPDSFRPGQWPVVKDLLQGHDVVCVLPTGAGKSLCYQLPALMLEGTAVVVSPLIALMRDQVRHLRERGIAAESLDSAMDRGELEAAMDCVRAGEARLVYVSPERLRNPAFAALFRRVRLSLLVVDEAHCVIDWGKEFRPAYREIASFVDGVSPRPAVCALTATLTPAARRDLTASLGLIRPRLHTLNLPRDNLVYDVCTTLDKDRTIARLTAEEPRGAAVVFCRTRARTEALAAALRRGGESAEAYHAGMSREERHRAQQRFTRGETRILTATTAFGMGVDIPGIRLAVVDAPAESLTALAQETGRAGRDGGPARCVLLLDPADLTRSVYRRRARRMECDGISLTHPLRRLTAWRGLRRAWREERAVLDVMLSGRCIPQGIAEGFRRREGICGHCSACRALLREGRWKPLAAVPCLPRMSPRDVTVWALAWQRNALAARLGLPPQAILPDRHLARCVRDGNLPESVPPEAREALDGILRHMRQPRRTDSPSPPEEPAA